MERVQREKDVFITMAQQLDKHELVKLKPLVDAMHHKIESYIQTRNQNMLDSLYFLLCDSVKLIKRNLLLKELNQKLYCIQEIGE